MTTTPFLAGLRVIVVDDEPLAREGLEESIHHLVAAGHVPNMTVVASCESGPEALAAIRERAPEIALVDVQMPLVSGLEMLAQLEPEAMPPAVIMVTAHA